jgi:hypothetical protein
MCAIPAIGQAIGGKVGGALTGGSLGGLAGAFIGSRLAKKKPATSTDPSFVNAIAQGVGPKKAMQTAILVNQRNAASASGKGY